MNAIGMIVSWWALSTFIALAASCCEIYPGKDETWGELILAILLFPGWVTLIVVILASIGFRVVWDYLDKPIRLSLIHI